MASFVPNCEHPALDDLHFVAHLQRLGSMPRSGTLAGVPVDRLLRSTITNSSAGGDRAVAVCAQARAPA